MRQIKAQDIKPGMEIEWKRGGYYTRCVVGLVQKEDLSYSAYSIRAVGSSAGWKIFSEGEEVTVLKEAHHREARDREGERIMKQIRANEVREGMEIRWEEDGAVITLPVFEVMTADCGRVSFVPESRTPWHVKRDQVVTVLREPQPEEPTEFGAAVEVAGKKYVLASHFSQARWVDEYDQWNRWGTLCEHGPVEVKPNPFATVQAEPEHRVWDRWEDVPDMVAVRSTTGNAYRKAPDGTERQTLDGEWGPSIMATSMMRSRAPFTEERDA